VARRCGTVYVRSKTEDSVITEGRIAGTIPHARESPVVKESSRQAHVHNLCAKEKKRPGIMDLSFSGPVDNSICEDVFV